MKPHKRNGKAAKARRQETASNRKIMRDQYLAWTVTMSEEERLITAIFGAWTKCEECGSSVLLHSDCQSPHCKSLREESSVFYEEVTEDHIQINGARMIAGVDY